MKLINGYSPTGYNPNLVFDAQAQRALQAYLARCRRYPNAAATASPYPGYFPPPPGQPPPGSRCPPTTRFPCASLVSQSTEDSLRGRNRTGNYTAPTLPGTAAGASAGVVFNAGFSTGAVDTWTAGVSPMWRTISFVDLIGSGLVGGLDDLSFDVIVSGVVKANFNGGIFSRSNANACTPACGISVCVGPLESVTVLATNQTAAVLGAAATIKLTTRTAYSGEPGFTCSEEGSCADIPAPAVPFTPSCECEGGA